MSIPTSALKRARELAKVKQTEMAKLLGVNPSVISRLEQSEMTDDQMARRYLEALDTPGSKEVLEFYGRDWRMSERPSVMHPDRESLWEAELALQKLDEFQRSSQYDALLDAPLTLIRDNLESSAAFLDKTDHAVAFVGSVGVGKTTALSLLTNLVIPDKGGVPQPVFPATGGRTTTSEVIIRVQPAYGIGVEPRSEDEIRLLVSEMVRAVVEGKGGIPTELERAVRNMADIRKRRNPSDIKSQIDPIAELLDSSSAEDVVEAIVNRMKLPERTETQLILSETNEEGLAWLSKNITAINFGLDPRFSLPQRVTVFVPKAAMRNSTFDVSVIDTKGIHGTIERSDLEKLANEGRTLIVLCSAFNDAPGADPLKLMKSLSALGSDAFERERLAILVLPQNDQALKVIDGSGEPAESIEHGYGIREDQIRSSLAEAGLPKVPSLFFNALSDQPGPVWDELNDRIARMRQHQLDRLHRFVALSDDLVTNADAARIQQARIAIAQEARAMAKAYKSLPTSVRSAHQTLIEELATGHPSSIAASISRRGGWDNFDIHHMIGSGVRADAYRRTADHLVKIKGRVESLEQRFEELPEVLGLLQTLREDLSDWRQEFLSRASSIGRNSFKPYLDGAEGFWSDLRARYGGGKGYREDIADQVKEWFEDNGELADARTKVDKRLEDAWNELVVDRLLASTLIEGEQV
ncbi:hypothetical protein ASD83_12835 [Devosia sp. Root685]|uniref:helix-turn-helix domain-containing protein n=1 Tax=Devosia sp. Root685 TaxID=1736587 RepID=UPI0006FBE233|nr:helix-turn-helix transcriptional regulator [Devosia sp. Root685]KRA97947.1 hypothetical protein ASD83_12835 [Devosia sp. Root685]